MVTRKNVRILILLACGIALILASTGCKKKEDVSKPNDVDEPVTGKGPDEPVTGKGPDEPVTGKGPDEPVTGKEPEKVYIVEPLVGIDKVRFDMTVEQMKEILGEPKQPRGALHEYRDAGFAIFAIRDVVKIITCGDMGSADSPLVKNCKCETDKGIRMGSSREDIIKAYGQPSSTDQLPGDIVMLSYEPLNSEFRLMQDSVIHMSFKAQGFMTGMRRPRPPRP